MIAFYPVPNKKRFILEYEDEDISFLNNIIGLMGERNTLLKEAEKRRNEE